MNDKEYADMLSDDEMQDSGFIRSVPLEEIPVPEPLSYEETQMPEDVPEELEEEHDDFIDDYESTDAPEPWKTELRENFEEWLDELSALPSPSPMEEEVDLYSFYEELVVLRNELKKGGRRNQEVLSKFGDSLSGFQEMMTAIQNRLKETEDNSSPFARLFLPLVDVLIRMERLEEKLLKPPAKSIFGSHESWLKAWRQFQDGFEITLFHLEELIKNEGLTRIVTEDVPFNPETMTAVGIDHSSKQPVDYVAEETSPGFILNGKTIKLAEVKVSRRKS